MFKLPIKQVVINDDALVTEVVAPADDFIIPVAGDAGNLISIEGYGSFLIPAAGSGEGWATEPTAPVLGEYTIAAPVATLEIGQIWDLKIYFKQGPRILADAGMQGDSVLLQSRPLATADDIGWVTAFIDALEVNPEYLGDDYILTITDGGAALNVTFKEGYEGVGIEIARSAEALNIDSLWITCVLTEVVAPEIGINTGKQIEAEVRLATYETTNPYGIYVCGNEPSVDINGAYTEQHWKGAIGTVNPDFAPHEMTGYGDVQTETVHMPTEYSVFTHDVTALGAKGLIDLLLAGGNTPAAAPPVVVEVTDGFRIIGISTSGPWQVDSEVIYAGSIGTGALTYVSDNVGVVTVDINTGVVTYVGDGSATITATSVEDGAFFADTNILMVAAIVNGVTDGTSISGAEGSATQTVDSIVTYSLGSGSGALTYVSSDDLIATVDAAGEVTFIAVGAVTITATSVEDAGFSGTTAVTVTAAVVSGVTAGTPLAGIALGTGSVDSTVTYSSGTGTGAMTYVSDTPGVATVDAAGLVTYVAIGSATITATSVENGTFSGTTTVTVS